MYLIRGRWIGGCIKSAIWLSASPKSPDGFAELPPDMKGNLVQTTVKDIANGVFFLGVGKDPLNGRKLHQKATLSWMLPGDSQERIHSVPGCRFTL